MFDRFFKATTLLNALMFAALMVYALHGYGGLPDLVAVDFDAAGEPVMGPKTYLATPIVVIVGAAGLVAALMAFFTLKRHTIVERYPYLISISAVAMILGRLPRYEARKYIDKLFLPSPIYVSEYPLVRLDYRCPCSALDRHVAERHPGLDLEPPRCLASKLDDVPNHSSSS